MSPTHWLYPVKAATDCQISTLVGPEALSLDALRRADLDRLATWSLASGYRLMTAGDLVWVYFARPDQVVAAVGRVTEIQANESGHRVVLAWEKAVTAALRVEPIPLAAIGRAPRTVRRADGDAVEALVTWLVKLPVTVSV